MVKNLEDLSQASDVLIIWTDCDREGEYIGDEIRKVCLKKNPRIRVLRARYSSVTSVEIRKALDNLTPLDNRIIDAVATRIELDLRSGIVFTRFLTVKLKERFQNLNNYPISYGIILP